MTGSAVGLGRDRISFRNFMYVLSSLSSNAILDRKTSKPYTIRGRTMSVRCELICMGLGHYVDSSKLIPLSQYLISPRIYIFQHDKIIFK